MAAPLVIRPDRYQQFSPADRPFYLVTDETLMDDFTIDGKGDVVAIDAARGLGATLADRTDEAADVLVAAPGSFLGPLAPEDLAGRRLAVLPCGSTPVTLDQLGAVLPVLERTDADAQARWAADFFTAVQDCENLSITDHAMATTCVFDPHTDGGEWHQQAGPLAPGEQQIAPAPQRGAVAVRGAQPARPGDRPRRI